MCGELVQLGFGIFLLVLGARVAAHQVLLAFILAAGVFYTHLQLGQLCLLYVDGGPVACGVDAKELGICLHQVAFLGGKVLERALHQRSQFHLVDRLHSGTLADELGGVIGHGHLGGLHDHGGGFLRAGGLVFLFLLLHENGANRCSYPCFVRAVRDDDLPGLQSGVDRLQSSVHRAGDHATQGHAVVLAHRIYEGSFAVIVHGCHRHHGHGGGVCQAHEHGAHAAGGQDAVRVVELGPQGIGVRGAHQQVVHNVNLAALAVAHAGGHAHAHFHRIGYLFGAAENPHHVALAQGEAHVDGVGLYDAVELLPGGHVVAAGEDLAPQLAGDLGADGAVVQVFAGAYQLGFGTGAPGLQLLHLGGGGFHILAGCRLALLQCLQAAVSGDAVLQLRIKLGQRCLALFHGCLVLQGVDAVQHISFLHHAAFLGYNLVQKALHCCPYFHGLDGFCVSDAAPHQQVSPLRRAFYLHRRRRHLRQRCPDQGRCDDECYGLHVFSAVSPALLHITSAR